MKRFACIAVFLAATAAIAQTPAPPTPPVPPTPPKPAVAVITGPASFKEHESAEFKVQPKGKLIRVKLPGGITVRKYDNGATWNVSGKPGNYAITGTDLQIDFDKKSYAEDDVAFPFEIVADAPPPPPVPPTPPTPPAPDPSVRTNPFSDDAARVLILFDPFPAVAPTVDQVNALYSDATRTATKAFAGDNTRTWPKGQTSTDPVWASALQKLPTSYPWVMTGKGSKGFSGPLKSAADVTAAIAAANVATAAGFTFSPSFTLQQADASLRQEIASSPGPWRPAPPIVGDPVVSAIVHSTSQPRCQFRIVNGQLVPFNCK